MLPNATKSMQLRLLPSLAIPKIDNELPKRPSDRMLSDDPNEQKSSTEKEDAIRPTPNTLKVLPKRLKLRTAKVLPQHMKSSTEQLLPRRPIPNNESELPRRQ
jgi:hypothetical protein